VTAGDNSRKTKIVARAPVGVLCLCVSVYKVLRAFEVINYRALVVSNLR